MKATASAARADTCQIHGGRLHWLDRGSDLVCPLCRAQAEQIMRMQAARATMDRRHGRPLEREQ